MPASNQLVDWATLRSLIDTDVGGFMYIEWNTSDPGTGTLPDARIATVSELITYMWMTTAGFATGRCPDYAGIQSMVLAPVIDVGNLIAESDANHINFDLNAVGGLPTSGVTFSYDILLNGFSIGIGSGHSAGDNIEFNTHGAMNVGDDVEVDISAIYGGNTIATANDSTTVSH